MSVNEEIFQYLSNAGCCITCCLRYLNGRNGDYYDVEKSLNDRGIVNNSSLCNNPENDEGEIIESINKRFKLNKCIACLGLFDDNKLSEIIELIIKEPNFTAIECNKYSLAISLPVSLNVRHLSLWIALKMKMPSLIKTDYPPDICLKDVLKIILNKKLQLKTEKLFDVDDSLQISIKYDYIDDNNEILNLSMLKPELFNKSRNIFITRNSFEKNFMPSKIIFENYCKLFPVPPLPPTNSIYMSNILLTGPTIFVAGRYCKLTRELSQTPWILEGRRIMEDSVQEIITKTILPYFNSIPEMSIFSSSGREDVDVRCLGKGRPFALEIINSFKTVLPNSVCELLELDIAKSKKITVRDLQIIKREELGKVKLGEEEKRKHYRALCITKVPITKDIINKLNNINELIISQRTPIRVLHRRPLHYRQRIVHSVKGRALHHHKNCIILDIVTQAGTYIKELVHGDFGRTTPSLSSILNLWIDIAALDVVAIEINWPKERDDSSVSII